MIKLLDNGNFERTDNDFCPDHRERLKYYCFLDDKALCVVCANYEDHRTHNVMRIADILEDSEKER